MKHRSEIAAPAIAWGWFEWAAVAAAAAFGAWAAAPYAFGAAWIMGAM
jgi:hypothetical protein